MSRKYLFVLAALAILTIAGCGSESAKVETVMITVTEKADTTQTQTESQSAAPATSSAPLNLRGTGDTSTQKFHLDEGLYRFTFTHDGNRNFIVMLLNSSGRDVAGIANVIGPANSNKVYGVREAGDYLFDIQADGAWTVSAQKE